MTIIKQSDFDLLQSYLLDLDGEWPMFDHPLYRRFERAARQAWSPSLDVAALVRQILHRESLRGGQDLKLVFPREMLTRGWPTVRQLRQCGIEVNSYNSTHHQLTALPWVMLGLEQDPTENASAEWPRGEQIRVPADPLFTQFTGHESYSSPGQRQALRAVWYSKPGATLAVLLPTGTGKSLVAHVPMLMAAQQGQISVLVVPTVALALDQQRSLLELSQVSGTPLPKMLAYHGGLGKGERQALVQRVRDGVQGVIITSPEHLMGSLSSLLYEVAGQGRLKYLAVDEAHLAAQWGGDFRPEFQTLSGLKRALVGYSPEDQAPVTLLMTATATERDLGVLRELFAAPGELELVAAITLRPEIEYWSVSFEDAEQRLRGLVEAVLHCPRPLVVYVSKVEHANRYHQVLMDLGLSRVGKLHGESSHKERERVIDQWSRGELDVVVGTSAFGVGIDQKEVRTVIHACVPESADRYYQEVGRGGRDGRAALALSLIAPGDWDVAQSLSTHTLIGSERGLERWERMFNAAQQVTWDVFMVDVKLQPKDQFSTNEQAVAWNVRTLNSMVQAGLIQLEHSPPPSRAHFESEQDYLAARETHWFTRWVRILDMEHTSKGVWQKKFEPYRKKLQQEDERSFRLLRKLLLGEQEASEVLCEVYRCTNIHSVQPQPSCAGCPVCRAEGAEPFSGSPVPPEVHHWEIPTLQAPLVQMFPTEQVNVLCFHNTLEMHWMLRKMVESGVQVLVDPEHALEAETLWELQHYSSLPVLWETEDNPWTVPEMPLVYLLPEGATTVPTTWLLPRSQPTFLLIPFGLHTTDLGEPIELQVPRVLQIKHLKG